MTVGDILQVLSPRVLGILQSPHHRTLTKAEAVLDDLESQGLYNAPEETKFMLKRVLGILDRPNPPRWSHGAQAAITALPSQILRAATERAEGSPPWFKFRLLLGGMYLTLSREYRETTVPKKVADLSAPITKPNAATAPFFPMRTE